MAIYSKFDNVKLVSLINYLGAKILITCSLKIGNKSQTPVKEEEKGKKGREQKTGKGAGTDPRIRSGMRLKLSSTRSQCAFRNIVRMSIPYL